MSFQFKRRGFIKSKKPLESKTPLKKSGRWSLKKTPAWLWFSRYIRERDNWTCVTCGKKEKGRNMHAGHFIQASGHSATYFDETNVHAQCFSCNYFGGTQVGINYSIYVREKYGNEYDKKLKEKSIGYKKYERNGEELKFIAKTYKDKYEFLVKENVKHSRQ